MEKTTSGCPRIAVGATAEVFTWGEGSVLKLFREGFSTEDAEQEAARVRAAAAAGVLTPAVIDVLTVEGRAGVVYERIDGPTMLETILTHPDRGKALAETLAELHAAMHSTSVSGLPPQRERLKRHIGEAAGLSEPIKEAVQTALDRLPEDRALCHGDFHPGNVLLTERGPVIIDWTDATQGHPLADVARTRLLLLVARLPEDIPDALRGQLTLLRQPFYEAYLQRYRQFRPFPSEELDAWLRPVAAARLSEWLPDREEKDALLQIAIQEQGEVGQVLV